MIRLTVSALIFIYTLLSVFAVLVLWVASNYLKGRPIADKDVNFIWKCAVCLNTYVDSKHEDISVCPQCGSYNKKEK